ncbi:MAG: (d)CMP kinase [Acidobacteriota bacterium]
MARQPLIVAIDGPAGAGKSVTARELAVRLGVPYLDTGAMYRAVALAARRAAVAFPLDDEGRSRVAELARRIRIEFRGDPRAQRVILDGADVSDEVRTPEVSRLASVISAVPGVRRELVGLQRDMAARTGGVVEGRDIGTVVFPDATLKVFLTATPEVRASRRLDELRHRGIEASYESVLVDQRERDQRDSTRSDSPLRPAGDAIVLDTSGLTIAQVVETLVDRVRRA